MLHFLPNLCLMSYFICLAYTRSAAVGVFAIISPLIIVLAVLFAQDSDYHSGPGYHAFPKSGNGFVAIGTSLGSVAFAFAGQVIFVEAHGEMRNPQHFPASSALTLSVMIGVYLIVSLLGYWLLGDEVSTPMTSDLPASQSQARAAANVLLLIHVAMAYVINANVLLRGPVRAMSNMMSGMNCFSLHEDDDDDDGDLPGHRTGNSNSKAAIAIASSSATTYPTVGLGQQKQERQQEKQQHPRCGYSSNSNRKSNTNSNSNNNNNIKSDNSLWWLWGAVSLVLMVFWVACSISIPGLQSLLALNGAACGLCIMFIFPYAFSLRLLGSVLPVWQHRVLIPILLVVTASFGVVCTVCVVWGVVIE